MRSWIGILLATTLLAPTTNQGQVGVHVAWPLVDFLVRSDTAGGVHLLASVNMSARQGRDLRLDDVWLDPIFVRQWTGIVLHDLDSLERTPKPKQLEVLGPPLPGRDSGIVMAVGYDPTGSDDEKLFLFWDDSTSHHIWRVAATASRMQALLDALAAMALRSELRPVPKSSDSVLVASAVSERPEELSIPRPFYPPMEQLQRREGRVWVQFVIDTLGKPEMRTVEVLFSDADDFTKAALDALARAKFRPARVGEKAVRVLIRMPFIFSLRH